jgi:hypothetical protein
MEHDWVKGGGWLLGDADRKPAARICSKCGVISTEKFYYLCDGTSQVKEPDCKEEQIRQFIE